MTAVRLEEGDGITAIGGWVDRTNRMADLIDACSPRRRLLPRSRAASFAVVASVCGGLLIAVATVLSRAEPWILASTVCGVLFAGECTRRWFAAEQGHELVAGGVLAEAMASPMSVRTIVGGVLFPWQHAKRTYFASCSLTAAAAAITMSIFANGNWTSMAMVVLLAGWAAYGLSSEGGAFWCGHDELVDMLRPPTAWTAMRGTACHLAALPLLAPLWVVTGWRLAPLGTLGMLLQAFVPAMLAGGAARLIRVNASRRAQERFGKAEGILGAAVEGNL